MATATFADGYGRWYAAVTPDTFDPVQAAHDAIRAGLEERGECGAGYRIAVERAPATITYGNRAVYREVWS